MEPFSNGYSFINQHLLIKHSVKSYISTRTQNKMRTATVILALAAVVVSASAQLGGDGHGWGWAKPQYKFSYAVADKHTGDHKNAEEHREGDVTKGSYSLVQPDGVVRTVKYIVTPHGGFQAQVLNNGWAAHPAQKGWGWGADLGRGLRGDLGGDLLGLGGARSSVGDVLRW